MTPRHPSPTLRLALRHPPAKEDESEEENNLFLIEDSGDNDDDYKIDQDIPDAVTTVAPIPAKPAKKRGKAALVPATPKKARVGTRGAAARAKK